MAIREISTVRNLTSMGRSTVKEQPRPSILSTILSATSQSLTNEEQNACIWSWQGKAKRVVVSGIVGLTPYKELTWYANGQPTLASVLTGYLLKIPGGEVFMVCAPDVDISAEQKPLFDYVENSGFGLGWASYFMVEDKEHPAAFVMSAYAMPYLMRYIPSQMPIDGFGWSKWMHEHLKSTMPTRYFDGTKFNIVSPWKKPT